MVALVGDAQEYVVDGVRKESGTVGKPVELGECESGGQEKICVLNIIANCG